MWFAYKLVSLNYWKQLIRFWLRLRKVVICLQISIFELLKTTSSTFGEQKAPLWFAYKLVSLNYWKQPYWFSRINDGVVICLQISIFELLKTTRARQRSCRTALWFAYKLVSLNYWKQQLVAHGEILRSCDLLTN